MKKLILFLCVSAGILVSILVGGFLSGESDTATLRHFQSYEGMTQTAEEKRTTREVALVSRVIDGDTIELGTGEKVRYIGIDAPETVDPRKPVQCFGAEAARRNKEFVENKLVILSRDISERDKYNRLLRYVWIGNTFVNLELVKEGYATAFTFPPDVKYASEFVAAEKEARETKRGLWGKCYN